ncbi:hypothetical protein SAMN05428985_102190 [Nocardioides sp. YR527]|uniref:hypothetical protein n=1 Tax=Nocardioides sp. YR527 TaxID=1881028 RepID=UPI00088A2938|nr:hypothetical protein [Nocardioides sp. YR527]SDJ99641.1 hypothetical protein SAMN05428985_102190 [Nocardioides sp. YR527]
MNAATPQYLAPVADAVDALNQLHRAMLGDLDDEQHGFTWWRGYIDDKRLALIAEYLIASVDGITSSLEDAAFLVDEFSQYSFADTKWTRDRISAAQQAGGDVGAIFRALHRSGLDEKRDRRMRLAREHLFYHLAQAFDRLAAVVVGVGALRTQILKADWRIIDSDEQWKKCQGTEKNRGAQSAAGREKQDELRRSILDAALVAGPSDWLQWIDGTRNTSAHRAPKMRMIAATKPTKAEPVRLVHLFERQPKWSMTEALVGKGLGFSSVWLMEDPLGLMRGALEATASVVETAVTSLSVVWADRRSDPQLLVQPGAQWPTVLEEPELNFSGFGHPVQIGLKGGQFRVAPEQGRRMKASGVFSPELWA